MGEDALIEEKSLHLLTFLDAMRLSGGAEQVTYVWRWSLGPSFQKMGIEKSQQFSLLFASNRFLYVSYCKSQPSRKIRLEDETDIFFCLCKF